jgi:hypothetical protein
MIMGRRRRAVVRTIQVAFVLGLGVFLGGCTSGESVAQFNIDVSGITKVAVVDVYGDIEGETAKNQIADFFGIELLRKGFEPVERSQLQSLLKEQQFQNLNVTATTDAVKAGQILNVSAVIVVNVQSGDEMSMTAKMIDVGKGTMLWMGSGASESSDGVLSRLGFTTTSASDTGSNGSDNAQTSTLGAGGKSIPAAQCLMAKRVIAKMCESMPSKLPPPAKT